MRLISTISPTPLYKRFVDNRDTYLVPHIDVHIYTVSQYLSYCLVGSLGFEPRFSCLRDRYFSQLSYNPNYLAAPHRVKLCLQHSKCRVQIVTLRGINLNCRAGNPTLSLTESESFPIQVRTCYALTLSRQILFSYATKKPPQFPGRLFSLNLLSYERKPPCHLFGCLG